MSEHYLRFIPEDVDVELDKNELYRLCKSIPFHSQPQIHYNEKVEFADAGQNFEKVLCPFCDMNITEWWSEEMGKAFSKECGFIDLKTITPCCKKKTSLNHLTYFYPQGFYKYMIELISDGTSCDVEKIILKLNEATGIKWRVIFTHY